VRPPDYERGPVKLWCGDSLELLPELPDAEDVGAIVADPPYGIGYVLSGKATRRGDMRRNVNKPLAMDGELDPAPWLPTPQRPWHVLIWGADHYATSFPAAGTWLAWDKSPQGRGPADTFVDGEFAWCSRASVKRNVCRYLWKGVVCVKDGESNGRRWHPTQKPVGLMIWSLNTLLGEESPTVWDPYMGSGSTGVACLRTGRRFLGSEIDPEHFETAVRRLDVELKQGRLF